MFDASRRPMRRLFYFWAAPVVSGAMVISTFGLAASGLRRPVFPRAAAALPQGGPALTTVSDTVYRADGEPAQGTLIITWPAFVTATGTAVAAGVSNVTIGANGALSVA